MTDTKLRNSGQVIRYGTSILDNLTIKHEQILEMIDEKMLVELSEIAAEGQTLHEMATHMHISFGEFLLARTKSEDFDNFIHLLETISASQHLRSARKGIVNPQIFSAAAYDRVMGALGFTPHVNHVYVDSDEEAEKRSSARVGFDVEEFMHKHDEQQLEPFDINPEDISTVEEEAESNSTDTPSEEEKDNSADSDNSAGSDNSADSDNSDWEDLM